MAVGIVRDTHRDLVAANDTGDAFKLFYLYEKVVNKVIPARGKDEKVITFQSRTSFEFNLDCFINYSVLILEVKGYE